MIDLPRSTYYHRSTTRASNLGDPELVAIIEDIQDELPCYGYRRVTHEGSVSKNRLMSERAPKIFSEIIDERFQAIFRVK